ncbi:MAG: TIGR03668 family PPOX class F420-dependent oxidoreductase [Acidimicrobiales bacterium]
MPDLLPARARDLFASARVARLATRNARGDIDLVPVTFALVGSDTIVTAVDRKPKRTTRLQRLANVEAHPAVTLLADHYDDADWSALWWVRARGVARVMNAGSELEDAVAALVARYPQYTDAVPSGPGIVVTVESWRGWAAR